MVLSSFGVDAHQWRTGTIAYVAVTVHNYLQRLGVALALPQEMPSERERDPVV